MPAQFSFETVSVADLRQRSLEILNSWKEIAAYLGRGVRTVQRWERDLGLPVHRPRGKQRSAVVAIPEEIERWIQRTPARSLENAISNHVELARHLRDESLVAGAAQERARLRSHSKALLQQAVAARERMLQLVEQLRVSARLTQQLMQANSDVKSSSRKYPPPRQTDRTKPPAAFVHPYWGKRGSGAISPAPGHELVDRFARGERRLQAITRQLSWKPLRALGTSPH